MTQTSIPSGFSPHQRKSPMTDPWQPLYRKLEASSFILGVEVRAAHCNGRGFLHGGLITTLADNAMGLSVIEHNTSQDLPVGRGYTLSLSVDFVRRGEIGDWIEFRPTVHKAGRTVSLVDCDIIANDKTLLARANATYMSVHVRPEQLGLKPELGC